MRLSEAERKTILDVFGELDPSAEVHLFGSRADDSLRGGDIDLLVISEVLGFSARITALALLKERLGEQKIDLVISTRERLKTDSFASAILVKAVRL